MSKGLHQIISDSIANLKKNSGGIRRYQHEPEMGLAVLMQIRRKVACIDSLQAGNSAVVFMAGGRQFKVRFTGETYPERKPAPVADFLIAARTDGRAYLAENFTGRVGAAWLDYECDVEGSAYPVCVGNKEFDAVVQQVVNELDVFRLKNGGLKMPRPPAKIVRRADDNPPKSGLARAVALLCSCTGGASINDYRHPTTPAKPPKRVV